MATRHHKPDHVFPNPPPPYYRPSAKPARAPSTQDDSASYRAPPPPPPVFSRPPPDARRASHNNPARHAPVSPSNYCKSTRPDLSLLRHRPYPYHYHHPRHVLNPASFTPLRPPHALPAPFVGSMSKDRFIDALALFLDSHADQNAHFISLPTYAEPESVFFSVSRPDIPTVDYVKRLVTYTQCSPSAFVVMMVYLERIANSNQKLRVTPFNMHRLLVSALTLSCKMLDDRCFSNVHYAKVGGIPTAKEMNRLELQFMKYINYKLHVAGEDYEKKHVSLENQALPTSPVSVCEGATAMSSTPDLDDVNSIPVPIDYTCTVSASARALTRHRSAPVASQMLNRPHHAPPHSRPHHPLRPSPDHAFGEWYAHQVSTTMSTTTTTVSQSSNDTHLFSYDSSQQPHHVFRSKDHTP